MSERSEFDVETDQEAEEKEGIAHPDFFDINIKPERIFKELEFIKKRLEDRKKVQIRQAMKMNKQLTKEQENKKKEIEKRKEEDVQSDLPESAKPEEKDQETDKDDKPDYDEKPKNDKQSIVILSPEEIKDKLENHIEDIGSRMQNRIKLSKRMLIRDMDADIMSSLTKALKSKREK